MRQKILESGRLEQTFMDTIRTLIPTLWQILDKKKCAINVTTIENELTVSIIGKRRTKRFTNTNSSVVISELTRYFQLC
jgi:hypothetical protein